MPRGQDTRLARGIKERASVCSFWNVEMVEPPPPGPYPFSGNKLEMAIFHWSLSLTAKSPAKKEASIQVANSAYLVVLVYCFRDDEKYIWMAIDVYTKPMLFREGIWKKKENVELKGIVVVENRRRGHEGLWRRGRWYLSHKQPSKSKTTQKKTDLVEPYAKANFATPPAPNF